MSSEQKSFEAALRRRSPRLEARPEQAGDRHFILELTATCSPIASLLPQSVLEQQSAAKEASHRAQHPDAMRAIVSVDGAPAGRIVLDWTKNGNSHGVDIAVLPQFRSSGAGLHMLRAWLDLADSVGVLCTLEVASNNPAAQIYRRLGFRPEAAGSSSDPFLRMIRPPRRAEAARRGMG